MRSIGRLTIDAKNVSSLDGRPLMKGDLNKGGFGRAAAFLKQDCQLSSGDTIWVEGEDRDFHGISVIVLTDAGYLVRAAAAEGESVLPVMALWAELSNRALAMRTKMGRARAAERRRNQTASPEGVNESAAKRSAESRSAAKKSSRGRSSIRSSAKESKRGQ